MSEVVSRAEVERLREEVSEDSKPMLPPLPHEVRGLLDSYERAMKALKASDRKLKNMANRHHDRSYEWDVSPEFRENARLLGEWENDR